MVIKVDTFSTQSSFWMSLHNRKANPTFKALYMPKNKEIVASLGKNCAKGINKAKPELERLAKDFDVFVSIDKSKEAYFDSLNVTVKKPTSFPEGYYVYDKPVSAPVMLANYKDTLDLIKKMPSDLVKTTKVLTNSFVKSIGVSPKEMINPNIDRNYVNQDILAYIAEKRIGKIEDLQRDLNLPDGRIESLNTIRYISKKLRSGRKPKAPQEYIIGSKALKDIMLQQLLGGSSQIIKPEYQEQFEKEIQSLIYRQHH